VRYASAARLVAICLAVLALSVEGVSASREATGKPTSSPLPGDLLIADKGNNRLLVVGRHYRIKWSFPHPGDMPRGQAFLIPDDAFFTPSKKTIIATEEDYHVIREIDYRTRRVIWQYGHPGIPGAASGYLNGPDDAYRLKNGLTTVADIRNCRILFIRQDHSIAHEYGRPGACWHDPPHTFAAPNGDTPLPDGGMLVTEIGGSWVNRFDSHFRLVWSFRAPVQYPSDAQLLPNGHVLISDYSLPGHILELDTRGRIVSAFGAESGSDLLNHPSLAIRLPNGLVAANDDRNHRVIIVDMRVLRIVWQYGHPGALGSAPGYLTTPDGVDFLPAH
jgi:hypothetical protein